MIQNKSVLKTVLQHLTDVITPCDCDHRLGLLACAIRSEQRKYVQSKKWCLFWSLPQLIQHPSALQLHCSLSRRLLLGAKDRTFRLLQLNDRMVTEDHLEKRWEAATGERVDEIIFLSRHTAVSNRPALTVHPIGIPHLLPHEQPPAGGRPGWAAPPCPRIGPWLRLLQRVAKSRNLVPEFEVTLEATHHGPETNVPAMFVEIGSTEDYWRREDAAQAVAEVVREGLGLDGGAGVGQWTSEQAGAKVLVGLGGGHYAPRHMDVVQKEGVWVGHLLSCYSMPMVEPTKEAGTPKSKSAVDYNDVGGSWKEAISEAVQTTRAAFPNGEVMAHLDSKSLKSWQRNAITWFLAQERIPIGKANEYL